MSIKSKYNTFVVQYNNLDYVLLKVRSLLNDTISFDEIINNRVYVSNIDPINWGKVWQQKIDQKANRHAAEQHKA